MPNRIALDQPYPLTAASDRIWERARGLIPAGTQTLAKGPGQYVRGVAPKYLVRARGAHVWDADGHEFLDMNMGIGPLVLGYADRAVDDAIRRQLDDGITFSLMHPLEVELAETLREVIPNAQSVRFAKSGAEATSAAIRVARAFTARERVLCCGYHGWHDWYISVTDRAAGIPAAVRELTNTFAYNDLGSLEDALDGDVAAVILEPMTFEEPRDDFLRHVKELTERAGALLIFDEMWTGFRLALGGAQGAFGVTPDLACFSKAVANGMPLSILAGRGDVMAALDRDVFFFTTFGGEALSLAAARATIDEMRERGVPASLQERGSVLRRGLEGLLADLGISEVKLVGYDCRTLVTFRPEAGDPLVLKSLLQQELLRRGILWGGFHNLSFSHTPEDIDYTVRAYADLLPGFAAAMREGRARSLLLGEPVGPVFRRTTNFHTKPAAVRS